MFCSNCGNRMEDSAKFCARCGTQMIRPSSPPAETAQDMSLPNFIDGHVRATTEYGSARELLECRVPMGFAIKCFAVPIAIMLVLGIWRYLDGTFDDVLSMIGLLVLALVPGYLAAFFGAGIKKIRCEGKYSNHIEGSVDIDDLIRFLNKNLVHLHPYFHSWRYVSRTALSIRGAVEGAIADSFRQSMKETVICTEFGEDGYRLAEIAIHVDPLEADKGTLVYFITAENSVDGYSFVSHDMGFAKYKCIYRIGPILQGAMEYYLHYVRNGEDKKK